MDVATTRKARSRKQASPGSCATFVAINPATNILLRFGKVTLGQTNRTNREPLECADGKALNAAMAFKHLGGQPTVVMVCAGRRGRVLRQRLRAESILVNSVLAQGECRRIYTLLSGDSETLVATHFVEEGPTLHDRELDRFVKSVIRACASTSVCVLSGSLPPGVQSDFYARLIHEIRAVSSCVTVVDTSGDSLLGVVSARPDIIKINEEEFASWAAPRGTSVADIKHAMAAICDSNRLKTLIVTRAGQSALAYCEGGRFREAIPPTVRVTNPVGPGDSFIAGMVLHLKDGIDMAFRMGVAAGTASVLGLVPGVIREDIVTMLSRRIRIRLS